MAVPGQLENYQKGLAPMLLLHISDIHFQHPNCDSGMDPDSPFRTVLASTVRQEVKRLGPVSAILVTGDIAYKGVAEEYTAALAWLRNLANVSGCSPEEIYVVPGNHDVDRGICSKNVSTANAQQSLLSAPNKERNLRDQYSYTDTARSLLAPIAAYNNFAAHFDNNLISPHRLRWIQDLTLPEGVILRLHGLTTTFLSGMHGQNDPKDRLVLTPLQTVLEPEDHVVNLVMAHHPPDWLSDSDDANEAICERAQLHLFGHKHRSRIEPTPAYVRYYAGAVNPERDHVGWEPGFNLIKLRVEREDRIRTLIVESMVMRWQNAPDRFTFKQMQGGGEILVTRLPVRGEYVPGGELTMASTSPPEPAAEVPGTTGSEPTPRAPATITKNLVFRFWTLSSSQRHEIAEELGLLDASDDPKLPESEKYGRALIRAKDRELLITLEEKIKARE